MKEDRPPTNEELRHATSLLSPMVLDEARVAVEKKLGTADAEQIQQRMRDHVLRLVETNQIPNLDWPDLVVTLDAEASTLEIAWSVDQPAPDLDAAKKIAALLCSSMASALQEIHPSTPPPFQVVAMGLSIYAALRIDFPTMSTDDAMAAAAWQVGEQVVGRPANPRNPVHH